MLKVPRAQPRLEALDLSDMTRTCALRTQAKPCMWGFPHRNVLHIAWFDLDHEVWPSMLKHTETAPARARPFLVDRPDRRWTLEAVDVELACLVEVGVVGGRVR